jgi:tetratricopeptide (TPR) repeat protein
MRLDHNDTHVALEYAFLCYETKKQAEARRIFDRIRKTGDPTSAATAEQAFQNIDTPLRTGIERWTKALEMNPGNFSAHDDLADLAEQRDEFALAGEHYLAAWHLLPDRKSVLLDLGRVLKAQNKIEEANAALLAASRGGETRAAEAARELLPTVIPMSTSSAKRSNSIPPTSSCGASWPTCCSA